LHNSNGNYLHTWDPLSDLGVYPCTYQLLMEFFENHLYLLADHTIMIFEMSKQPQQPQPDLSYPKCIYKWTFPRIVWCNPQPRANGVTIDRQEELGGRVIYYTLECGNLIYLYTEDGKKLKHFGIDEFDRTEPGLFHRPKGLTIKGTSLYVCDGFNHRIQVIKKDTGQFLQLWGPLHGRTYGSGSYTTSLLTYPQLIICYEDIFYVTDCYQLFAFSGEGHLLQMIYSTREPNVLDGLCIVEDKLYIVEYENHRVQYLERKL